MQCPKCNSYNLEKTVTEISPVVFSYDEQDEDAYDISSANGGCIDNVDESQWECQNCHHSWEEEEESVVVSRKERGRLKALEEALITAICDNSVTIGGEHQEIIANLIAEGVENAH